MFNYKRVPVLLVGVFILVAVLFSLFFKRQSVNQSITSSSQQAQLELSNTDITVVTAKVLDRNISITGTVKSIAEASIASAYGGEVKRLLKREGEWVKKGELLVEFNSEKLLASIDEAKANVETLTAQMRLSQQNLNQARELLSQNFISSASFNNSQANFDVAKGNLAASQARLSVLQKQLHETRLEAPFEGVVSEIYAKVGDTVSREKPVLKILDPRHLEAEATIPAFEIPNIKVGMPVTFYLNHVTNMTKKYKATLKRLAPAVTAGTRAVSVYATLESAQALPPVGAFVEGYITLGDTPPVLAVPIQAVREIAGQQFVYRLSNNKLQSVAVTLGTRSSTGDWVAVTSGLQAGDRIVNTQLGTLQSGALLRTIEIRK